MDTKFPEEGKVTITLNPKQKANSGYHCMFRNGAGILKLAVNAKALMELPVNI